MGYNYTSVAYAQQLVQEGKCKGFITGLLITVEQSGTMATEGWDNKRVLNLSRGDKAIVINPGDIIDGEVDKVAIVYVDRDNAVNEYGVELPGNTFTPCTYYIAKTCLNFHNAKEVAIYLFK